MECFLFAQKLLLWISEKTIECFLFAQNLLLWIAEKTNNWMLSICTDSMEKRKAPNWTIGRAKTCLTAEEAIREPILVTDQRTRPSYLYFLKMISMSYYLAHISFCLGLGIYSYSTSLSRRWTLSFQLDLCGKLPLSISFKSPVLESYHSAILNGGQFLI